MPTRSLKNNLLNSAFGKLFIGLATVACFVGQFALAGSADVNGTGLNGGAWTWSTLGDWTGGAAPGTIAGDVVGLSGNFTNNATITIDTTSRTLGILNIGDTTSTFRLVTVDSSGGASLTFDNSGSNAQLNSSVGNASNTAAVTLSAPILLNSSLDIRNSSTAASLLTLSTGGITSATSGTKTISNLGSGTAGVTISGVIGNGSGTVAVTQNSANSTLTLSGVNTYTGGTTVSAGTLSVGGTATATGTNITGSATGTGNVTFASGTSLSSVSGSTWFAPTITLAGAGSTLNLIANNRLQVGYNILELGDSGRSGVTTINVNGVSKAVTGGNTLASESTGQWGWEVATTVATGATTTIQNGTLDLETTAFSGTNYGMHFIRATNFNNADLTIGNNVILGANGSGALGTSATTSPNLTINASGILNMLGSSKSVKSLAGSGSIFNSMVTTNTNASTLNIIGTTGSTIFSGVIADGPGTGALGVTKSAGSTQILSGNNSYSGNTTVSAGVLNIQNATALGNTTGSTSVSSGAALQIQGNITVGAEALSLNGTGISTDGALRNISGTNVWQGTVTLGAASRINSDAGSLTFNTAANSITGTDTAVTFGGAGNTTVGGTITTGTGTLTKDGAGTLNLSGTNTYSGLTTLGAGTLVANNAQALGTGALSITSGVTAPILDLQTYSTVTNTTITGTANASILVNAAPSTASASYTLGTLAMPAATLAVSRGANVTTTGNLTFGTTTLSVGTAVFDTGSGINLTLGAVGGNFILTKQGAGTLTLNTTGTRSNSSGGTTLTTGTLRIGAANALNTAITTPVLNLNGGTLSIGLDTGAQIGGAGSVVVNVATATIEVDRATAGAGVTDSMNQISLGAQTLNVTAGSNVTSGTAGLNLTTATGAFTLTADGGILNLGTGVAVASTGSIAGNFSFTKQGAGSLAFNAGSSRSSGQTTLTAGTLKLGATAGLGTSATTLALNGGTLDLATDSSISAYGTTIGGNVIIQSDKATASSAGTTHTLGTLSIGANTLTLSAGSNVSSGTAGLTFGATTLTGAANFSLGAGTLLTLGAVTNSTFTPTITGAGNLAQAGVWGSGSGGITFDSGFSGTATLNQTNTFTGAVTANGGTLVIGGNNANLGAAGGGLALGGAQLQILDNTARTFANGNTTVSADTTILVNRTTAGAGTTQTLGTLAIGAQTLTVNLGTATNVTSGTEGLTFGATTLSGNATFTINNNTSGGTGLLTVGAITNGSNSLTLKGTGNFAQTGVYGNGAGGLILDSTYSGTATLNQANTFTGGVTVNAGTLRIGVSSTFASGAVTTGAAGNGPVTLNNGATLAGGGFVLGASQFNINGDVTIGTSASSGRLTTNAATYDLGGTAASNGSSGTVRTLSLYGSQVASAITGSTSGNNQFTVEAQTNGYATNTIANGTLRFVAAGNVAAGSLSGVQLGTMAFTNNTGLTIGDKVYTVITNGTPFATPTAPRLTIESGGYFNAASGANSGRIINVFSLSGAGVYTNLSSASTGNKNSALTINGADTATFSGIIADGTAYTSVFSGAGAVDGTVSLTKAGSGTQILSGANSYTGTTTISGGTLQFAKTASLYNGTSGSWTGANIKVASGGTLALNVGGTNEFTTGNVTTLLTNLGGANGSSAAGFAASSAIGFDTTNASGGTFTVVDVIANSTGTGGGAIGLSKLGTNTLVLTNTNTYSGATTVTSGTLQLGNGSTTGKLSTSSAIVNNGTFTINRSNAVAQGTDFSSSAISGSGAFVQAGGGTTTLNVANSYSGKTTVQTGTLSFTNGNASASANQALGTNAAVDLGVASTSSGKLQYTGTGAATLAKDINALGNGTDTVQNSGTGQLTLSGTITKNGTVLSLNGGANGIKVTGKILGSAANSDLVITGGTTQLTNTNTYNGPTSIQNTGTLDLTSGGSISSTTNVTVNTGGTLLLSGTNNNKINDSATMTLDGGKIQFGGSASLSETVGTLTLSSSSIIDFGTFAGGNTLIFGDSHGASWTGVGLSIWNWTAGTDHLYFGNSSGGLTSVQSGLIHLFSDGGSTSLGSASIGSSGEISAVPEPSSVFVAMSLLSLAFWRERRWFLRCRKA